MPRSTPQDPHASMLQAFQDAGAEIQEIGGNRPLHLDTETCVWWVERGRVEVFTAGKEAADQRRLHLCTLYAGQMLFGVQPPAADDAVAPNRQSLLAFGAQDTRLLRLPLAALMSLARQSQHIDALVQGIDHWLAALFQSITRSAAPNRFAVLDGGREVSFGGDEEEAFARTSGGVVWVRHLSGGSHFLGRTELPVAPAPYLLPVSAETWLETEGPTSLSCVASVHLLRSGSLWEGLSQFHALFLRYVELERERARRQDFGRLNQRHQQDQEAMGEAAQRLAEVLSGQPHSPTQLPAGQRGDALFMAAQEVAGTLGMTLQAPPEERTTSHHGRYLQRLCEVSHVRARQVMLRDTWWTEDNGPLVAFRVDPDGDTNRRLRGDPVALLPRSHQTYELIDPMGSGERVVVDAEVAEGLEGEAFMLYPALPARPVKVADLLKLALRGQGHDLRTLALMGIGSGLLALLVPILTAQIISQVIPSADRGLLGPMVLALVAASLATAIFSVVRGIAVLRLSAKLDGALQSAIWDRLLTLPTGFFRSFSVGDLVNRSMGIDSIRDLLVGRIATSLLDAVFSIFSFALLFYYSMRLALLAAALTTVLLMVTVVLILLQLRYQRQLLEVQGRLASMLFGLLNGLSKLRIAGAEARGFALWAKHFSEERRYTVRARHLANLQAAFNGFWRLTTLLVLFGFMGMASELDLSLAEFLAFNAAYGQFQMAAMSLISVFSSGLLIAPLYERLHPILEAVPEVDEAKIEAAELAGGIELSHISFRYQEDGPLILDDVSIHAEPGEMIALVGPSGSGKSTCMRLLLGFEKPLAGSIYFDGQDLPSLSVNSVRRQMGVVLQNSKPIAGDIFRNIVGNANLGLQDAWEAARMVGLEDDIKAMPMGMHTLISEGASTFSGGQQQRLLIARAIAHRPRIIIFDEATSALDNRTQDIVSRSLEGLRATRFVVAHRLSTIRNADRIYVLEAGRVVEVGTYDELIALGGTFTRLAERQLA